MAAPPVAPRDGGLAREELLRECRERTQISGQSGGSRKTSTEIASLGCAEKQEARKRLSCTLSIHVT